MWWLLGYLGLSGIGLAVLVRLMRRAPYMDDDGHYTDAEGNPLTSTKSTEKPHE